MSKNVTGREQRLIGRTKALLDAGYTVPEIMEALGLSEATVRAFKHVIDEAKSKTE